MLRSECGFTNLQPHTHTHTHTHTAKINWTTFGPLMQPFKLKDNSGLFQLRPSFHSFDLNSVIITQLIQRAKTNKNYSLTLMLQFNVGLRFDVFKKDLTLNISLFFAWCVSETPLTLTQSGILMMRIYSYSVNSLWFPSRVLQTSVVFCLSTLKINRWPVRVNKAYCTVSDILYSQATTLLHHTQNATPS